METELYDELFDDRANRKAGSSGHTWVSFPRLPELQMDFFAEFLDLSEKSLNDPENSRARRIEHFARRFGPLGICAHGRRSIDCWHLQSESSSGMVKVPGLPGTWMSFDSNDAAESEAHDMWVEVASLFESVLVVTGKWRTSSPAVEREAAERNLLNALVKLTLPTPPAADITCNAQRLVTFAINALLELAGARPRMDFDEDSGFSLQDHAGPTVLGVLALHLARTIERGENEWICAGCNAYRPRKMAPFRGHTYYCKAEECQKLRRKLQKRKDRAHKMATCDAVEGPMS